MLYPLIKSLLFLFDPESIHNHSIHLGKFLSRKPRLISALKKFYSFSEDSLGMEISGIKFPNLIGLSAGFDKNGVVLPLMYSLGYGFIEVGTVTPFAQSGNKKPRIFRLIEDGSLINRLGFNNDGIDQLISNIKSFDYKCPIGINIGKNKVRPIEQATEDYLECLEKSWNYATYFTINISSPNTKNLRELQSKLYLYPLLKAIINKRYELQKLTKISRPIWLKIAPDLKENEIEFIAEIATELKLDALIVSNTSTSRSNLISTNQRQSGGLSGKALKKLSNYVLKKMYKDTKGKIPLVGVGGIFDGADAFEKIQLGASLIQIWAGMIYNGPSIVKKIATELTLILHKNGFKSAREAVGTKVNF